MLERIQAALSAANPDTYNLRQVDATTYHIKAIVCHPDEIVQLLLDLSSDADIHIVGGLVVVSTAYQTWKQTVDNIIAGRLGGLTSNDLPDTDIRGMHRDGASPLAAAKRIIRNSKEF